MVMAGGHGVDQVLLPNSACEVIRQILKSYDDCSAAAQLKGLT